VETYRALTLFVKEQGTVEWIRSTVQPGDVFYDIGANIGMYTLLAASRVGDAGKVYAFEPHVRNFTSLLQNVALNNLSGRVAPICSALHDTEGFLNFNYLTWQAGSSTSQLGTE
jgi:FkbM family methyltransferase